MGKDRIKSACRKLDGINDRILCDTQMTFKSAADNITISPLNIKKECIFLSKAY